MSCAEMRVLLHGMLDRQLSGRARRSDRGCSHIRRTNWVFFSDEHCDAVPPRKGSGVHRRLSIARSWEAGERPARREPTGLLLQISASAVTSRSICSSECSGVGVSRRRSVPRGTVG